jgi:hypothetical protein
LFAGDITSPPALFKCTVALSIGKRVRESFMVPEKFILRDFAERRMSGSKTAELPGIAKFSSI